MEQLLNTDNQNDNVRFVIADDNKINQYIIHFMLKPRFINFNFAENGEDAIKALDADLEKLNILLLDLNMPDMDGFEVLDFLSKHPEKYSSVKTICISAMHFDHSKEQVCLGLCDYYLEKPVDKKQLLDIVLNCIASN